MALMPRVVLVHRRTEYEELVARHGSHGQAEFFLDTRGRAITEVLGRKRTQDEAQREVQAAIPLGWRLGRVERRDLPRFLFAPEDIVVVVGQDGLVANLSKYLDGQVVIGINADPARNPGILVQHAPSVARKLIEGAASGTLTIEGHTMVEAKADDGQTLVALNEIFIGHPSHQTARYSVATPDGRAESHASSGLVVGSGSGATGWCRSIWQERASSLCLPRPTDRTLIWFAREAWPSPATDTSVTEGLLEQPLVIRAESDQLIAFGDGLEEDHLTLKWGQRLEVGAAAQVLRLARG